MAGEPADAPEDSSENGQRLTEGLGLGAHVTPVGQGHHQHYQGA